MRVIDRAWTGLRWLFGLFFFATGVLIAVSLIFRVGHPPTQSRAAAAALDTALHKSGIIDPLLAAGYVAGGTALFLRRTTPLGLVLLAPAVVVITVFDIVLAAAPIGGLVTGAVWGLLALRHFDGFRGLWTYDAPMRVA